ncbi:MAG TPA: hypothetical protein VMS74_11605 [Acidimicrobiia bacterium]|nr:hypothetical protein [Acidimicrobiia bacterium]
MIEPLERIDPAAGVVIDKASLRARVEERVHGTSPTPSRVGRRRLVAALASTAVVAAGLLVLQPSPPVDALPLLTPGFGGLGDLPGIDTVVTLEMGGVKTMAVDADTIWVMEARQRRLHRVDAELGEIETTYRIDAYVEGVVVGGDYLWLLSYDSGGEVLRFEPSSGRVDKRIPLGGEPRHGAAWFGDNLWVSNDQGQLMQISSSGEIVGTVTGELKGEGFGYLWANDPATGIISSLSADGTRGEFEIPTVTRGETADGWGVRSVAEGGPSLFLMDGYYPFGTNLSTFDPATGEFRSFVSLTFGLLDMVSYDGALWVTSHTDHVLMRVDPTTGQVRRYPMPGKPGGLVVADGSLWVSLYHPGALVRVDPAAGMLEMGPIVADDWNRYPHRLVCTGPEGTTGPTVILEPYDWIDYGSWSVVQARLTEEGYLVCVNGYVEGEASPQVRAADLEDALTAYGIPMPYVLVASGDGVHPLRLFAEDRSDLAGVVLVDPMPVGFGSFLDATLGEGGHPVWADISPDVSNSLDGLGNLPLTVIGQDPQAVFLSERALEGLGEEKAQAINAYWQEGLAVYSHLSIDATSVIAEGTGMHMVIWDRPDLVVRSVLEVIARG